jgi:hypothetical protein
VSANTHSEPQAPEPKNANPRAAISSWYLLESGAGQPAFNMALDEALLEALPRLGQPVLRLYSWAVPTASFGYFQRYADVERLTHLRPLVRRPTGGGVVPHESDWTYSLLLPVREEWYSLAAPESYRRVHAWIQAAFARLNVPTELALRGRSSGPGRCFAGYERFDLLWGGQKIAGAAQRRTRHGLLIQGSVQPPPLSLARRDWEAALRACAPLAGGVTWRELVLDGELAGNASRLAAGKYSQAEFLRKR